MMNRHMEALMKQDRIYPPAHDRAGDGIPKKCLRFQLDRLLGPTRGHL